MISLLTQPPIHTQNKGWNLPGYVPIQVYSWPLRFVINNVVLT